MKTMCQVHLGKDKNRTYALKKMKKKFIVDTKQQQHVMQEKRLLLAVHCQFIVRFYHTHSSLMATLSTATCSNPRLHKP